MVQQSNLVAEGPPSSRWQEITGRDFYTEMLMLPIETDRQRNAEQEIARWAATCRDRRTDEVMRSGVGMVDCAGRAERYIVRPILRAIETYRGQRAERVERVTCHVDYAWERLCWEIEFWRAPRLCYSITREFFSGLGISGQEVHGVVDYVCTRVRQESRAAHDRRPTARVHVRPDEIVVDYGYGGPVIPTAHQKSIELLKRWLPPKQLVQFEQSGWFEVAGSQSGDAYRITQQHNFNVIDLANRRKLCFVPDGDLPIGDVMLAQKLAIENDEVAAIRVANVGPLYEPS